MGIPPPLHQLASGLSRRFTDAAFGPGALEFAERLDGCFRGSLASATLWAPDAFCQARHTTLLAATPTSRKGRAEAMQAGLVKEEEGPK
jgi:hypothetical protein